MQNKKSTNPAALGLQNQYFSVHLQGCLLYTSYSDTSAFTNQFEYDVNQVFEYAKYRQVFETNGNLDMSKVIVTVSDGNPNNELDYTVEEIVDYAKVHGYTLNKNWEITDIPVSEELEDEPLLYVTQKAYDPEAEYTEPMDAYMTLSDISYEVLSHLGAYSLSLIHI